MTLIGSPTLPMTINAQPSTATSADLRGLAVSGGCMAAWISGC
jgi:hypothetical protein